MSKRLHLAAAALAGLVLFVPVGTTVAADCGRYSLEGVRPGMEAREVWKALGGKGYERNREEGPLGPVSGVRYRRSGSSLYVLFDAEVTRKANAHVVLVRLCTPERIVDAESMARSLAVRFGEPARGGEGLAAGFRKADVVWLDPECDAVIRARHKPGDWWAPDDGAFEVEVESLAYAAAMARLRGEPLDLPEPPKATARAPSSPAPAPAASATTPAPAVLPAKVPEPSSRVVPARRIPESYVPPVYPQRARAARIEAEVTLEVRVLPDGSVGDVRVVECTRPRWGFEDAAVAAVKRWRYRPATADGTAVEQLLRVVIRFRL